MITDPGDYFAKGCGRCDRFATPECSTRRWAAGLAALRRICLEAGLTETAKWGHPCYMHAGRNIARGPGMGNLDIALIKDFAFSERTRLQFRAECFNLTNHANFALPVNDLASPSFGRILEAGPSRLIQFGLKLFF